MLQAGVIGIFMLKEKTPGGYETASAPTKTTGAGAYVLIRFQPQARPTKSPSSCRPTN